MKIERTWNPLTFKDDNIVVEVEAGLTPNEIIRQAGFDFQRPFYLTINGEPLGRDEWDTYQVQETDVCHFVELPGVATIGAWLAQTILMSMAGAGATMSHALVWGITYASYAVAATAVIGGLGLVNRFLGQSPQTPSSIGQADEIYSVTSGSNRKRINSPYAEQFGKLKIYPDLASAPYVEYSNAINIARWADKPEGHQYMYFLGIIGIGEYDISKVQIDETDVDDMPGVEYSIIQPGNTDIIPYHSSVVYTVDTFNGQIINQAFDANYQPQQCVINPPGQTSSIGYIAFDLSFPNGVFYMTDEGAKYPSGVFIQARVRKIDATTGEPVGDWINPLPVNNAGLWEQYQTEIQGLFIGGIMYKATRITLHAPVPDGWGRYEIKIGCIDVSPDDTRHINDCQLGQIRGFGGYHSDDWVGSDFSDCTLLAMKVRADINLTGAIADKINVICTRKLYPVTATGFGASKAATRSIVDAVAYMVTSDNGGKQDESLLDFESLYALRTELETAGWYFDYRFQSRMSVMEACALAAKCGRSVPYLPGKFVLIQDTEQSTPSGKFTSEDYTEGTFCLSHNFKTADSPTGIQIKCVDADTWEEIYVDCYDDDGSDQNLAVVPLEGCTSRQQAYDIGMYMYLDDKNNRSDVEFTTGLQGHIPLPGSRIMIDIPAADGWQRSGLIHSISGSTIHLSEPIEWGGETSGVIYLTGTGAALAGPYAVTPGAEDYIVSGSLPAGTKTVVTDAGDAARYLFAFSSDETVSMRVTRIGPSGTNNIKISGTIYGALPYVSPGTAPDPIVTTLLDSVSLAYNGVVSDAYSYSLGWVGSASKVKIELDEGSGYVLKEDNYTSNTYSFSVSTATSISVKVTPYDGEVLSSSDAIIKTYTVPGTVTNLALVGSIGEDWEITWTAVSGAEKYYIWIEVDGAVVGQTSTATVGYSFTYQDMLDWGGPYASWTVYVAAQIGSDLGKPDSLLCEYSWAPTALTATGKAYAILLQITYTATSSFQAVEIWMSATNDRSAAQKIGETGASQFLAVGLEIGDIRYFWVRIRLSGGTYSDWYPEGSTAGVQGQVSTDPVDYAQILDESIDEDKLIEDLRSRLDKIDRDWWYVPGFMGSGFFQGLDLENYDRKAEVTVLESTVNDPTTGVEANATAISTLNTQVSTHDGEIDAIAADVVDLETVVYDPSTGVSANASAVSTLTTQVSTHDGEIDAVAADVVELETTLVDPNTGVTITASAFSGLVTTVDSLDDYASAAWVLNLDANGNVVGIVAFADSNDTSQLKIIANQFYVVNPSNSLDTMVPFIVDTTTNTVAVDGDLIATGTILGNRLVANAQITLGSGGSFTAGTGSSFTLSEGCTVSIASGLLDVDTGSLPDGSDLIGYWPLDYITGNIAADASGNLMHSTSIYGATAINIANGKIGNCFSTVGVNGYIKIPFYTNWDFSEAAYVGTTSVSAKESALTAIAFSDTGHRMFVMGTSSDQLHQYSLSTPWQISSASYADSFSPSSQEASPYAFSFSEDGTELYIVGAGATVYQYSLSTPWSLSSASYASKSFDASGQVTTPRGLQVAPGSSKIFIYCSTSGYVYQYKIETPGDISTATYANKSFNVKSYDSNMGQFCFARGGQYFLLVGTTNDTIRILQTTEPYDVYNMTTLTTKSVSAQTSTPSGIAVNSAGTMLYINNTGSNVYEYQMGSAAKTAFNDAFAFSFWLKGLNAVDGTDYAPIISFENVGGTYRHEFNAGNINSGGANMRSYQAKFSNGAGSYLATIANASAWDYTDGWTHVVWQADPSAGTHQVYINGELDQEYSGGAFSPLTVTNNWYIMIGANGTNAGLYIDEVRAYNRLLTENEIVGLRDYAAGPPPKVQQIVDGTVIPQPPGINPGLYITGSHLGYWNGGEWAACITNSGDFQFLGNAGNKIIWDGDTLAIRGELAADNITVGTLTVTQIGEDEITLFETSEVTTDYSGNNAFQTVNQASLSTPDVAADVLVTFTAVLTYYSGIKTVQYQIYRDATLLFDTGAIAGDYTVFPSITIADSLSADASVTYYAKWKGADSTVTVTQSVLTAMARRR